MPTYTHSHTDASRHTDTCMHARTHAYIHAHTQCKFTSPPQMRGDPRCVMGSKRSWTRLMLTSMRWATTSHLQLMTSGHYYRLRYLTSTRQWPERWDDTHITVL